MYDKIKRFFRCAGKAVLPKVPKWIAKAAGLDLIGDMCEVGEDFYKNWVGESSEAQARGELQAVAQPLPPAQLKEIVQQVVAELAANQPEEVQRGLTQYLMQIPGATRQALKRPADPCGTTVPATMALKKVADAIGLLPVGLAQFTPGDRPGCLHGDWELIELLGRGGQGEVWKACRTDDADFVAAFKFCTDPDAKRQLQLSHEKAVVQRVRRASLEGVVTLEDYKLDSSPPWLRYELVEGGDLAGLVHEWNEQPDVGRTLMVLPILQRLAKTVGQFHRLGEPVIHRDLKPANILVRRRHGEEEFLIADFGIGHIAARRNLEQAKIATNFGKSIGTLRYACTPLYASPQQQQGDDPDLRDDVYALGVIWYQLVLRNLSKSAPTGLGWDKRLRSLGMSDGHIQLLGECLAGDPDDRPRNAQELFERLAQLTIAAPAKATRNPDDILEGPPTDEKHWRDNYPRAYECATWYQNLLRNAGGDVRPKFTRGWITLYLNGRVRVSVPARKSDQVQVYIQKLNDDDLNEAEKKLNSERTVCTRTVENHLLVRGKLGELKESVHVHEWVAKLLVKES